MQFLVLYGAAQYDRWQLSQGLPGASKYVLHQQSTGLCLFDTCDIYDNNSAGDCVLNHSNVKPLI